MSRQVVSLLALDGTTHAALLPEVTGPEYPDSEPRVVSFSGSIYAREGSSFVYGARETPLEYREIVPVAADPAPADGVTGSSS